jgi:hypothetical protein
VLRAAQGVQDRLEDCIPMGNGLVGGRHDAPVKREPLTVNRG